MPKNDSICNAYSRVWIRTIGLAVLITVAPLSARSQTNDVASRVAAAVLPLPEAMRADATVVSSPSSGNVVLRKGTNGMVCTDETTAETFSAYCFNESFFVLLKRATELSKQLGSPDTGKPVAEALEKEIKAGKLTLPVQSSVGFAMRGPMKAYSPATQTVSGEIKSWQMVQVPYATGKALALPEQSSPGMPWVMAAGTWMAHIMIEH